MAANTGAASTVTAAAGTPSVKEMSIKAFPS